ncbi:hypothetical protein ISF_06821 [Cordyceps fumosorosea ARSEF 2679]|uniref:PCI domain-containing protein n=1 Tax=Cordyceps fumosorosea (strain ARSEF 2679) TaxID=1081104 RepID=A0A167R587_CORFA|nr:hypothetical protein ISF_06821 [Cordyceps fumosorosea ARSEF 2679]OAA58282.1 hypothetical protein ISF_06821 [Cordyceps fumosorosea ARSEF 2679]
MLATSLYTVLAITFGAATVAADVTLTKNGCIDPSSFESCQAAANKKTSACIAQAKKDGSQQELLACGCQDSVDNFNCYAASCWNQVWGCQYQEYIVQYFRGCPIAKQPVPYFPAPNNAPAACSCNLGKIFFAYNGAIQQAAQCVHNQNSGDAGANLQVMQGCNCCQISGAMSSFFEICPNTDPKLLGLNNIGQLQTAANTQFSSCGKYLNTYDCAKDLGFKLDGVSTYLKPDDQLTTGTATISNVPGTVTAPASGRVFTYTNGGDGTVYTITAAGKFSDSGSGSGSPPGSGSGSDSASGSANPSQTSKPKSAGTAISVSGLSAVAAALCAVALL